MLVSEQKFNAAVERITALESQNIALKAAIETDEEKDAAIANLSNAIEQINEVVAALKGEIAEAKKEAEEAKASTDEKEEELKATRESVAIAAAKAAIAMMAKAGSDPIETSGKAPEAADKMKLGAFRDLSNAAQNQFIANGGKLID